MINLENLIANRLGGTSFGKEDKIYKFEKIKKSNKQSQWPGYSEPMFHRCVFH